MSEMPVIEDRAAERAVLGSMLYAPSIIPDVAEVVDAGDFYLPAHEAVFSALVDLASRGEPTDPVAVQNWLRQGSDPAAQAGADHIAELATGTVPGAGTYHAQIVHDRARERRLLAACQQGIQRTRSGGQTDEVVADVLRYIDEAARTKATSDVGKSAADLVAEQVDALSSEREPGITTGWGDLDGYVNGLRPGQLIIVGARPSMGKSVIAANLTAHACANGIGVHFASLEMTRGEVMNRLLSSESSTDLGRLEAHRLTEKDWDRIAPKADTIRRWPLWVDDTESQSLAQLRARARRTARKVNLGLIVVDYLQLMAPRDRRVPREQQVGELSEGLKAMAKELRVPVVALAQLNRAAMDRQDKRPAMSDLRESGRIEADADGIWLLHRQDMVDPKSASGEMEVLIAKNRNGVAGATVTLQFQGHYSRAVSQAWSPSRSAS